MFKVRIPGGDFFLDNKFINHYMRLIDELIGFVKSASEYVDILENFSPDQPSPYIKVSGLPQQGAIGFKVEALQEIDKAVASIKNRTNRAQFRVTSETFLKEGLIGIISSYKIGGKTENELRQDISEFIKNIQIKKCVCTIPIFNIIVRERHKFGDIRVFPKDQLIEELNERGIEKDNHSFVINGLKLEEELSALFSISIEGADDEYTKNKAIAKLEEFLNFIRAFNRIVFSYYGLRMRSQSLLVSCDEKQGFTLSQWAVDRDLFAQPLDFDLFSKHFPLDEIFGERPSKLKFIHIRRALVWLGNSTNYQDRAQQFLLKVIALESLILVEEDPSSSKKNLIADRCAFLMKTDPAERMSIHDFVIQAYNKRSKIAHGDYTEEINDSMLRKLNDLVLALAIQLMYDNRFDSIKDIAEFAKNQKFQ